MKIRTRSSVGGFFSFGKFTRRGLITTEGTGVVPSVSRNSLRVCGQIPLRLSGLISFRVPTLSLSLRPQSASDRTFGLSPDEFCCTREPLVRVEISLEHSRRTTATVEFQQPISLCGHGWNPLGVDRRIPLGVIT